MDSRTSCLKISLSSYQNEQTTLLGLKTNPQLTEVHISGPITDEDVGLLCKDVLLEAKSLEKVTLELSECSDDGATHIANLIEHTTSIKHMLLLLNNVGERGAQILAGGVSRSSLQGFAIYATQLDLHDHCIGDTGAEYIAAAVRDHPTLKKLCVAQNGLSNTGLSYILSSLQSSCMITELDLCTNLIDTEGAKLIGAFLSVNNTLRKLILNENFSIRSEGAKEIALSLSKNSSLEHLSLRSCGIGKKGAERFAMSLTQNSTIRVLDLCGNNEVGDDAVELISRGLKENRSLLELNLSCCGLGDEGCAHLAEALLANATLTHLWLQKNEIGDGGILSLSETLRHNSTLCLLSVSGNRFSHKGSTALIQSLSSNSTLTSLDIDGSKGASTREAGNMKSMVDILLDKNRQLLYYKNWTKELLKTNKELTKERDTLKKQIPKKK